MSTLAEPVEHIRLVWRQGLTGGGVILACAVAGWRVGGRPANPLARIVRWWLGRVLRPLLASRAWRRRAAIIFANNAAVCATAVSVGALGHAGWIAVAGIGLGLGIALRLLLTELPVHALGEPAALPQGTGRLLAGIGFALNMLEVPAILVTAGLCLGQGAMGRALTLPDAVAAYAWCVIPLLAVGAAGEALWMSIEPNPLGTTADGRTTDEKGEDDC